MSAPGDAVNRYVISLCDDCLNGAGGECHTPGCGLWMNRAPDLPIRVEGPVPFADDPRAASAPHRGRVGSRHMAEPKKPCPKCGGRWTYTSSHGYVCNCPIPVPPTARRREQS